MKQRRRRHHQWTMGLCAIGIRSDCMTLSEMMMMQIQSKNMYILLKSYVLRSISCSLGRSNFSSQRRNISHTHGGAICAQPNQSWKRIEQATKIGTYRSDECNTRE